MNKKVLIIYTSIGLGHKVVAENIAQALRFFADAQNDMKLEVKLLDLFEMYRGPLVGISKKLYQFSIHNLPWLWRFFYNNRLFNKLTLPLRIPFAGIKANKLGCYIDEQKPDLILSTQTAATALVSYLKSKKRYHGKLAVTFSDYHFQPYWVYPGVDKYLVMIPEQVAEIVNLGFLPKQIALTGLPVDQAFLEQFTGSEILQELNLSRTKPIILVMGGSRSWGIKWEDIQSLLKSHLDFQIVVLVSFAQELFEKLARLALQHPENLKVFGNLTVQAVAKLFSVAKILVTKPGGLTVAQALLKNLPMILVNPLPAAEEHNQTYLVGQGVALVAVDSTSLRGWVETLLLDQKFYQELKARMKPRASPNAGKQAATAIIDTLKI